MIPSVDKSSAPVIITSYFIDFKQTQNIILEVDVGNCFFEMGTYRLQISSELVH